MTTKIFYKPLTVNMDRGYLSDTSFFDSFNWDNFTFGDVVWLEDCNETDAPAAVYLGKTSDNAINLRGISYRSAYIMERQEA